MQSIRSKERVHTANARHVAGSTNPLPRKSWISATAAAVAFAALAATFTARMAGVAGVRLVFGNSAVALIRVVRIRLIRFVAAIGLAAVNSAFLRGVRRRLMLRGR